MRAKRALPLAFRIAAIYAMLVAATLLVVAGLALQFTRAQVTGQVDNYLRGAVQAFRGNVPDAVSKDVAAGTPLVDALRGRSTVWLSQTPFASDQGVLVVIRPNQTILSGGLGLIGITDHSQQDRILTGDTTSWFTVPGAKGSSIRMLRVPIRVGAPNGPAAATLIVGAYQSSVVNRNVTRLLKSIALASGIGLAFATVLGLFAVRRTLGPLETMSREVETIQETDDLSKRVGGRGPLDEVGRLAEGFDRMLGRLQEAFLSQRRFLSDASHELRTPMTVVRGQLELLAMDVESLAGRRSMSIAVEELDRMGRIVEDLLLLARLDEGMLLAKESVEVELVVGEALLRGMLMGPGEVTVQVPPGLTVLADADRLLQVLTNLVTNAVRHGGNAPINVSARRVMGDSVEIDVADRGPGISAEDLPHVFERLYRGSKARSQAPGGAGLGLAIASSLVRAMDGTIGVESMVGLGTTFTVTLPAAEPIVPKTSPSSKRRRSAPVEAGR